MTKKQKVLIYFANQQDKMPIYYAMKRLVRRAVTETLSYERYENDTQLSVTFSDNEGIRQINREFRGIDRPTDVLSFPLIEFDGGEEPAVDEPQSMLGDVVISLERAMEQAQEYGHPFEREVAFLTVHSMLHLLGYDHERGEEEEKEMRLRQREILDRMGLSVK